MRRSEAGAATRLGRLAFLTAAFVFAAYMVPTQAALTGAAPGNPEARADADAALMAVFEGPDRWIVEQGRSNELVGRPVTSLELRSFAGGFLDLAESGRIVILSFVGADCEECAPELAKLSALSVVFFEEAYVAAVALDGEGEAVEAMMQDAGGTGLVLGGEDAGNEIAERFEITSRPTTVVLGPQSAVDAVWSEPVPLNVYYKFLEAAYGIKSSS